ncbi:peptidase domain-containing ABC transporter [Comamonas composti]|uniref:peptidase domain-containing ABC transporter n=1 Tax=Comamonas composti TaxID=408558 RepID=UPI0004094DE9|nr:ATP-binding cassette domain-containing protein [Comamonas composti]
MLGYLHPFPTTAAASASPPGDTQDSPASAIAHAFAKARQQLHKAAWLSLPIGLLGLLPSIFLLQVYNRVIAHGGTATLTAMVAGALCFLGLEWWLRRQRARALREAGAMIDRDVSQALMHSMLRRPLAALEQRPASQWLQLFRDVGTMRSGLSGGLASAMLDLPMAALALIVVGIIAWPVLPVLLVAMLILGLLAWWWSDEVRSGRVEEIARSRLLDRGTAEICNARVTLKVLGYDAAALQTWQAGYDRWLAESFSRNGELENARESSTVLLTLFSIAVITVGAIAINAQWMSIGALMAVNLLSGKALAPVAQLAGGWRSMAQANEAAQRLQSALQEPQQIAAQELELPRPKGRLVLDQVSYQYPGGHLALEQVSLDIGPGGLHVIVGRNGAGKSTLAKLIAGLYQPDQGRIFIDEYDMAQFSREDLGRWIGCLAQQVYWFSGPIIEALRMAAADADDRQILTACQLTGAHDFISRLPHGYQTPLGEAGAGLSAGELRKLALAQLFLRNPSVLVLDEPSSDLDFESETALLQTLLRIAAQHTVIIVTHSPRVASLARRIYHVRGDGSVEQGTPAELMPSLFGIPAAQTASQASASQTNAAQAPAEELTP